MLVETINNLKGAEQLCDTLWNLKIVKSSTLKVDAFDIIKNPFCPPEPGFFNFGQAQKQAGTGPYGPRSRPKSSGPDPKRRRRPLVARRDLTTVIYSHSTLSVDASRQFSVFDEDYRITMQEYSSRVIMRRHESEGMDGALRAVKKWPRVQPYWRRVRRRICWRCYRQVDLSEPRFLVCSGCGDARYCSEECQREDWPVHQHKCTA